MDTITSVANQYPNDWLAYLWPLLFLVGLVLLQKYIYLFDQKLAAISHVIPFHPKKPWSLYAAGALGLVVYMYNIFSSRDIQLNLNDWFTFKWLVLALAGVIVVGVVIESIVFFGGRTVLFRIVVYLFLMVIYFYAGFVFGLLLAAVLALLVLVYFIRYFKNLLTIQ